MTCSVLAFNGCFADLWGGLTGLLPWWAPWAFWGLLALIALWALAKVKEVFGWQGVTAVIAAVAYAFGYVRGKKGESPFPNEQLPPNHPDAAPPPVTPRRRDRTIFDRLNGK